MNATERPAGRQMIVLKALIESRPFFNRVPDQALLLGGVVPAGLHAQATRDVQGKYALIYVPTNDQTVTIDLTKLRTQKLRGWWYYPRTGIAKPLGVESHRAQSAFKMPPQAPNWVLALEDPEAGYTPGNSYSGSFFKK
jgi:Putative collagen-binding domain of a collagenase